MHKILYYFVIFILIASCNNTNNTERSIEELVPDNATFVLSINSIESFKSALKTRT